VIDAQFIDLVERASDLHTARGTYPPADASSYRRLLERNRADNSLRTTARAAHRGRWRSTRLFRALGCHPRLVPERLSGLLGRGGPYAGQGYMRAEGMQLTLRFAFNELRLHRVEANIQPGNKKIAGACEAIRLPSRRLFCRAI
jgi:hypothetical protein